MTAHVNIHIHILTILIAIAVQVSLFIVFRVWFYPLQLHCSWLGQHSFCASVPVGDIPVWAGSCLSGQSHETGA